MRKKLISVLRDLYDFEVITWQQYKTFKGQVYAGDYIGCIRGLERKGFITPSRAKELMRRK